MKKNYDSMDAYKVSFNASEQVAAACQVQNIGTKYDASAGAGTMILCNDIGKWAAEGWTSNCQNDSTVSGMMKYAD